MTCVESCATSVGESAIKSLKATRSSNIERTVGPVDVIFRIAATCNCRASDLGSSEHGEIAPCVTGASPSETASDSEVKTYAIQYAAQLLITIDGPDATERRMNCARKNQYRRNMPPFGETVMYMQIAGTRQRRKYDDRWDTGISLNSMSEARCCWLERQVVCSK